MIFLWALFFLFLTNTFPFVAIVFALIIFMPRRVWGANLYFSKRNSIQRINTQNNKRAYLLGVILAALISLVLVVGLDPDLSDDAACQAMASKLHVICQQDQDDNDN